jgi:diacylglycerol kinase family enzyme
MNYKNLSTELSVNGDCISTNITNLGIMKNPHFSGDFYYDSQADYTNGKFDVHLAYDMNRFEVLNLMKALMHDSFSQLKKTKSWQTDRIKITSENNLAVEFDGEVVIVREVEFKIVKKFIKVCGNGKSI